jgi:WD40 repeat protein
MAVTGTWIVEVEQAIISRAEHWEQGLIAQPQNPKLVVETGSPAATVPSVAFSPDGHIIACAIENEIKLWVPYNGMELRRFSGHSALVDTIAFRVHLKIPVW